MNIWRMKLREGDYGDDMLPSCQMRGIASMTHPPIYNTDLTHLAKKDVDPEVKTAARSSIWRFAWEIRGRGHRFHRRLSLKVDNRQRLRQLRARNTRVPL